MLDHAAAALGQGDSPARLLGEIAERHPEPLLPRYHLTIAKLPHRDLAGATAEVESILSRDAAALQAASNPALVYRTLLGRHGEAMRLQESALA